MMKFRKNLSLLQKSTAIAAAFTVAFGITGCSSDDETAAATFTPFERIATLDVVTDQAGAVDYAATYAKAENVAKVIHDYIRYTDETTFTHEDGSNYPANWIIAGQDDASFPVTSGAGMIRIPSPDKIIPTDPASPSNTYKINVMDICNGYYAAKALGKSDIVPGQKVANGFIHAPALPCEVTVYNDGDNIYVDMLNPDAIFTLFFSDTVFGAQMDDADFAGEISQLPGKVKTELKAIVYAALDGAAVMPAKDLNMVMLPPDYYAYTALSEKLGPTYTQNEILDTVDASPYNSPYLHFSYMKGDASEFTAAEVKGVASSIIQTMSIHGEQTTDLRAAGEHVLALESLLSPGSSWRSARGFPLGLPGVGMDAGSNPYKNFVIEACSPKYAKLAMGTGRHHAGALPCEISVTAIESEAGSGVYNTLVISFLEPGFMFTAMFKDAFATMTEAELLEYEALPPAVLQDLKTIVNHSIANDLNVTVSSGGRLIYDMMPN